MTGTSPPLPAAFRLQSDRGFSLVELIVVMAIFIVVMIVTSATFDNIIARAGGQMSTATTEVEGVVGLEVLRYDIEHAGYGLPWSFDSTPNPYSETTLGAGALAPGVNPSVFNDPAGTPPHPLLFGAATKQVNGDDALIGGRGPDYVVIKSAVASLTPESRRWTYVNYSSVGGVNSSVLKRWNNGSDFQDKDSVITLRTGYGDGGETRQLVMNGTAFHYAVNGPKPPSAFMPGDGTQLFVTYGVAHDVALRMPYNRTDYYIRKADGIGGSCSPGTGTLFKAFYAQGDDADEYTELPLVNCVGDMKVVFQMRDDAGSESYQSVSVLPGEMTAEQMRNSLKTVRVYLLAHEGTYDRRFSFPYTDPANVLVVGDKGMPSQARVWTADAMKEAFGDNWRNYRWKVYTLAIKPKNLR